MKLIIFFLILFVTNSVIAQTVKAPIHTQPFEPEKIIELPKLTSKIAKEKLGPIWDAHNCDDPEVFWVYNYGSAREIKRRVDLVVNSIRLRCDIIGFRVLYVDAGLGKGPLTVVWRTWPGTTPPKP